MSTPPTLSFGQSNLAGGGLTFGSGLGQTAATATTAVNLTANTAPLSTINLTTSASQLPVLGAPSITTGLVAGGGGGGGGLPSFSLPVASSAAPTAAAAAPTPIASLTTSTATTAAVPATAAQPTSQQLNFFQLEEHINKWTLALEEQEKMFINQATQVNSWDKVLIVNNDKIVALNDAVQKVKSDQNALEHELEFIAAQQSELEECIAPLHQELTKTQHVDGDKVQTYVLAENLDSQLRQMSEDLKEVIEHLNAANKSKDMSDPMVKIGMILNAHMNSLQWIESTVGQVSTKIDGISQMFDTMRRDNERSIRLTYN